jgi:dihydroorotate dehydrogenase
MGLYQAVARPLLFALPPEAAHRVAHAVLGLPLPWDAIGAVPDDPRLRVCVAGLDLPNPVGLAAGFDKECAHLDALGRLGFGFVVGGTVTRHPRPGNRKPRIVRYPARRSLANSMGLPNPGAEAVAKRLRSIPRTGPRLVSVADEAVEDVVATHAMLEPLVDGVELNASCPNVSWGRDRDNEAHLASLLRGLNARRRTPLFVKLPPFGTDVEREVVLALAGIAVDGGADGLTCSNTRPVAETRLGSGLGGLSGAALAADTPRIVREVGRATGGSVPINACGGISSAEDAIACLEAGAATVQLYTALLYEGPRIVRTITEGLIAAIDAGRLDRADAVRAPSEPNAG